MFILKKIIGQLFSPGPLCLEILIAGLILLLFTRKQKAGKIVISIGVALFILISYTPTSKALLKPLEYQYPAFNATVQSDKAADNAVPSVKWIVVLGGGHTSDPKIPVTSQLSDASLVRLIEGVRLYKVISGSKLILSGGEVFDLAPEAETMAEIARSIGVKHEDVILESCSRDTADQARLIKQIVRNDEFILVTSAVHMPRSMAMFKKLSMRPIPAPTGYFVKKNRGISPGDFFPSADRFLKIESALHEYLGIVWEKLKGQI